MENVRNFEKKVGCDIKWRCDIHPIDREGCVGKSGIDKTYTLDMVLKLAYKIEDKPNIIIKAGPNAKWYLKRCPKEMIETKIQELQKWKNTSSCTMYIIDWDE